MGNLQGVEAGVPSLIERPDSREHRRTTRSVINGRPSVTTGDCADNGDALHCELPVRYHAGVQEMMEEEREPAEEFRRSADTD